MWLSAHPFAFMKALIDQFYGFLMIKTQANEAAQCVVCLTGPRDTYLNCGHIICRACSDRVERCPICRTSITTRSRAFV